MKALKLFCGFLVSGLFFACGNEDCQVPPQRFGFTLVDSSGTQLLDSNSSAYVSKDSIILYNSGDKIIAYKVYHTSNGQEDWEYWVIEPEVYGFDIDEVLYLKVYDDQKVYTDTLRLVAMSNKDRCGSSRKTTYVNDELCDYLQWSKYEEEWPCIVVVD